MTEAELLNEVARLQVAIRKHRDYRGDFRCWQDDLELYSVLPEGVDGADLRLPPPEEMLENCRKYIACRHQLGHEYVSPQKKIEELEEENRWLHKRLDNINDAINDHEKRIRILMAQ